jgi:hypothetical protein
MSRVLVANWGPDAKAYVGRSLTLYRDPKVKWGGLEVGGIRISHMSNIDAPMTMALTTTRSNRQPFTVRPLVGERQAPKPDNLQPTVNALLTSAQGGMKKLEADWTALTPEIRKALRAELAGLKKIAEEADAADDFNTPSSPAPGAPTAEAGPSSEKEEAADSFSEGPDDSQRGDGDADAMVNAASAWIDRYEAACVGKEPDGKKLAAIHRERRRDRRDDQGAVPRSLRGASGDGAAGRCA